MHHRGPRAVIDLGHWNGAPADSRLLGLADLLTWDGYQVIRARQRLVPELLEGVHVLVIAGPLAYPPGLWPLAEAVGWAGRSAFSPDETAAVRDWVSQGGGLLLAPNIAGSAAAASTLAEAFGLIFHECPAEVFLSEVTLGEHPLLFGRPSMYEEVENASVVARGWIEAPASAAPLLSAPPEASGFCGPGKPLAEALQLGRGRVAALAVRLERDDGRMRRANNRQLTLNIVRWLSGSGN